MGLAVWSAVGETEPAELCLQHRESRQHPMVHNNRRAIYKWNIVSSVNNHILGKRVSLSLSPRFVIEAQHKCRNVIKPTRLPASTFTISLYVALHTLLLWQNSQCHVSCWAMLVNARNIFSWRIIMLNTPFFSTLFHKVEYTVL